MIACWSVAGSAVNFADRGARLRAAASVREDRVDQAAVLRARPAVVQEEDPLADAPQRRGAEHVAGRGALGDVVGQPGPHVVDREVGVRVD